MIAKFKRDENQQKQKWRSLKITGEKKRKMRLREARID